MISVVAFGVIVACVLLVLCLFVFRIGIGEDLENLLDSYLEWIFQKTKKEWIRKSLFYIPVVLIHALIVMGIGYSILVAARTLDTEQTTLVLEFDTPEARENYRAYVCKSIARCTDDTVFIDIQE